MQKRTSVFGTGTNFMPRVFSKGLSLVARARSRSARGRNRGGNGRRRVFGDGHGDCGSASGERVAVGEDGLGIFEVAGFGQLDFEGLEGLLKGRVQRGADFVRLGGPGLSQGDERLGRIRRVTRAARRFRRLPPPSGSPGGAVRVLTRASTRAFSSPKAVVSFRSPASAAWLRRTSRPRRYLVARSPSWVRRAVR